MSSQILCSQKEDSCLSFQISNISSLVFLASSNLFSEVLFIFVRNIKIIFNYLLSLSSYLSLKLLYYQALLILHFKYFSSLYFLERWAYLAMRSCLSWLITQEWIPAVLSGPYGIPGIQPLLAACKCPTCYVLWFLLLHLFFYLNKLYQYDSSTISPIFHETDYKSPFQTFLYTAQTLS